MERQANYALVGVIFVVLLFGSFVFAVWLANFQFNQTFDKYRIYLVGPVSGLSVGGQVQFNGIKVGEITRIELDEKDPNKVQTDIQVKAHTPVRVDSTATAVSDGITGVKYIQITPGTATKPLLRKVSRDKPPVILARRGKMQDFVDSLSKAADGGAEALARVNILLSDGNLASISEALTDVKSVTGELRSHRDMFTQLDSAIAKIDSASGDLQATMASTRGALGGKDKGALADISKAAAELHGAAGDIRVLVKQLDGPVSEFSNNSLPEATLALVSVQRAAARLDSLAGAIESNPSALLKSRPAREMELPK